MANVDTTKTPEEVALIQAGQAFRRAKVRLDLKRDEMYDLMREARARDVPLSAIADLAGVSKALAAQVTTEGKTA